MQHHPHLNTNSIQCTEVKLTFRQCLNYQNVSEHLNQICYSVLSINAETNQKFSINIYTYNLSS